MNYWFRLKKKFPFYFPLNWKGYFVYGLFFVLLAFFTWYVPRETENIGGGIGFLLSLIHLLLILIYFLDITCENPKFMKRC